MFAYRGIVCRGFPDAVVTRYFPMCPAQAKGREKSDFSEIASRVPMASRGRDFEKFQNTATFGGSRTRTGGRVPVSGA